MAEAASRYNRADDGTLVLGQDYLEVVPTKRPQQMTRPEDLPRGIVSIGSP